MTDTKTDSHAILVIESDPLAAMTICHTLVRQAVPVPAVHARNYEDALLLLRHHLRQRPSLMLVDTQDQARPLEDFLGLLRVDKHLAAIPVVALVSEPTLSLESLVHRTGIADAMAKAPDYAEFSEQIAHLITYWITLRLASLAA